MYQRMCCCTYCCIAVASRGWVGWCVTVGGWVGGWRAGSWLWVVDVFCSFVFWTHGAFTTRRWSAAYELDTHNSTAVRYCCTAVVHGGWVDRLVGVSMGSWLGRWSGASVGTWLFSAFVTVGGDPVVLIACFRHGDPVLFLVLFSSVIIMPAPLWHCYAYR